MWAAQSSSLAMSTTAICNVWMCHKIHWEMIVPTLRMRIDPHSVVARGGFCTFVYLLQTAFYVVPVYTQVHILRRLHNITWCELWTSKTVFTCQHSAVWYSLTLSLMTTALGGFPASREDALSVRTAEDRSKGECFLGFRDNENSSIFRAPTWTAHLVTLISL